MAVYISIYIVLYWSGKLKLSAGRELTRRARLRRRKPFYSALAALLLGLACVLFYSAFQ